MTRVIVCGGRDYTDDDALNAALDRFHAQHRITCVIQGGATGADALAYKWAADRRVVVHHVPADWKTYGKAAGPKRNEQMLREFSPNAVIAFPGGRGTAHMKKIAREAGVPVFVPAAADQPPPPPGAAPKQGET